MRYHPYSIESNNHERVSHLRHDTINLIIKGIIYIFAIIQNVCTEKNKSIVKHVYSFAEDDRRCGIAVKCQFMQILVSIRQVAACKLQLHVLAGGSTLNYPLPPGGRDPHVTQYVIPATVHTECI